MTVACKDGRRCASLTDRVGGTKTSALPRRRRAMPRAGLAETSVFVTVLEQKSFAAAARQLGLSPPRVSEMVRSLEDSLDVRLVERTTRSVAPTVAGEQLLQRLRPLLDEYQAALESV